MAGFRGVIAAWLLLSVVAVPAQEPPDPVVQTIAEIRALMDQSRAVEAEAVARKAIANAEIRSGPDSLPVAQLLEHLASALGLQGRPLDELRASIERSLEIKRRVYGPDHPEVASTLSLLGYALQQRGDVDQGQEFLWQALAMQERTLGPAHPQLIRTLHRLVDGLTLKNALGEALPLVERALRIAEANFPADDPNVAMSLDRAGRVRVGLGDLTAVRLFERALTIKEKILPPDHPQIAESLNNLAVVCATLGQYERAQTYLRRALDIKERTPGYSPLDLARTLHNLFVLSNSLDDFTSARAYAIRALEVAEAASDPDVGLHLVSLGSAYLSLGDLARAEEHLLRGLDADRRVHGSEYVGRSHALRTLADVYVALGRYQRARECLDEALPIVMKAYGPINPELANTLVGMGRVRVLMGDASEAFELFARAEEIQLNQLRSTGRILTEGELLLFGARADRWAPLNGLLTLATDHDRALSPSRAYDVLLRSRAVALDETASRHRAVVGAASEDTGVLVGALMAARRRLANLVVRGQERLPDEAYRGSLDEALRDKEAAERQLAERSVPFRAELERTRLGLLDVGAALGPDETLVGFVRFEPIDWSATRVGQRVDGPPGRYAAFILRKGASEPAVLDLGSAVDIDSLVMEWRSRLGDAASAHGVGERRLESAYRSVAGRLRQYVWDPLEPYLRNARTVFIVPDGGLHLVNFAALPIDESGYLLESGPTIHYLSTERDLVPATGSANTDGLLAIGAPAFDDHAAVGEADTVASVTREPAGDGQPARPACGTLAGMTFDPLPATAREVSDVTSIWSRPNGFRRREATELLGATVTETAFKAQAGGKRVLHLATHGFFLDDGSCPSVVDAPDGNFAGSAITRGNPLLLSGLALAGANRRELAGPDAEDGILTAEEIATLDLVGTEWAVLSACDTGLGQIRAGEGVFGLRRAFQIAGVRTVIMSLWQVEDDSTQRWMSALYRLRFADGRSTATAVREASLEVLRYRRAHGQSAHPFYWAAFIATGDWR